MPTASVADVLVKRLRATTRLGEDDLRAIRSLPIEVKARRANELVVADGERPEQCCLVVEGFCARAKTTRDGGRQILSIHIAGDIPDLQSLYLHVMDHDLVTLSDCMLGFINHQALRNLTRQRPDIAEVFWRDTLIDAALFREWIVNLGQRPAPSRFAHLAMELRERLKIIGKVRGASFDMPLTQEQIGEALGITAIHVNRILKQLRHDGVVDFSRGVLNVLDEGRLRAQADFDDLYLHQSPSR